jgi:hypothetical protein
VTDFVQKVIPHNARIPAQSPFDKQLNEKLKDGRLRNVKMAAYSIHWRQKKPPELPYDLPQTIYV